MFAGGIRGEGCAAVRTRVLALAGGETARVGVLLTIPPRGEVDGADTHARGPTQRESFGRIRAV